MVNSTMALSHISGSYVHMRLLIYWKDRAICEVFRQKISLRLSLWDLLSLLESSLTLFMLLSNKRIKHICPLKMALPWGDDSQLDWLRARTGPSQIPLFHMLAVGNLHNFSKLLKRALTLLTWEEYYYRLYFGVFPYYLSADKRTIEICLAHKARTEIEYT